MGGCLVIGRILVVGSRILCVMRRGRRGGIDLRDCRAYLLGIWNHRVPYYS